MSRRTRLVPTIGVGAALALVLGVLGVPAVAQEARPWVDLDRLWGSGSVPGTPHSPPDGSRLPSATTHRAEVGASAEARAPRPVKVVRRTASLRMGTAQDAAPAPAQYVDRLEVVQDVARKSVVVTATYEAAPTAALNSALFVLLGTWDAEEKTCNARVQLGARAHSSSATDAGAIRTADEKPAADTVRRELVGSTLTISMAGGTAGDAGHDCVYALSVDNETGSAQMSANARDFVAEYEKAPVLEFHASDLHAAYPKRWNRISLTVRNEGDAAARNLRVSAAGTKLALKKKTVKVGNLAPGKRTTVTLRVKLTGRKTRTLRVRAVTDGGWEASTRTKVGHRPRPTKVGSLAGRSYWASETESRSGWNVRRMVFVNRSWVFVGASPTKVPACRATVKGCRRYTYSPRTGALRVGKMRAKVDSEGITITKGAPGDATVYSPLRIPKAGSRLTATVKYYDYDGCEGSFSCSSWWRVLTLRGDGTFRWSYDAIHSSGMPGNETMVSVSGPHAAGRYAILSKGRIRFSYVDEKSGRPKVETHLVGIDSDVLGRFAPRHGLLVGGKPHFG